MMSAVTQSRISRSIHVSIVALVWWLASEFTPVTSIANDATADQVTFFETRIRPILATHCYECHSATSKKLLADLRVDYRDGMIRGGDSGPAIVPGDADASLLVAAVRYDAYEMPPSGKLSDDEIRDIERWIDEGAPWPSEPEPTASSPRSDTFDLERRRSEHWVWQPVQSPAVPSVDASIHFRNDIDAFILASIHAQQLTPSPPIDKRSLLRRLSIDLAGLPPSRQQMDEWLKDESENAVTDCIDQWLASPHFGERWGRHWLDLVRYAESRGHEFDADIPGAYQYRDYVIRAFNDDVPYDQFVREHIAGDLMASPRHHRDLGFNESILGTAFWFFGEWTHSPVDVRKDEADRFDNMIDVFSKTFLGVTVACARCHDHKFDAISTRDYYALSGFLQSSDYRHLPFESLVHNQAVEDRRRQLDQAYQSRLTELVGPPTSTSENETFDGITTIVDYANLNDDDFRSDGFIFGDGPVSADQWQCVDDNGATRLAAWQTTAARSDPFWNGMTNHVEPSTRGPGAIDPVGRAGRTLRTPTFTVGNGRIYCEVAGEGQIVACVDSHRLIAGPLHGETIAAFRTFPADGDPSTLIPPMTWVAMNLSRYAGHRVHLEFTPSIDKPIVVSRVVESSPTATAPFSTRSNSLTFFDDRAMSPSLDGADELASLRAAWKSERDALRADVQQHSALAIAIFDGTSEDDTLLIRGNSANPGTVVPRRFLQAIDGDAPFTAARSRSGRLELADRLTDAANPLVDRVYVNRVWHHLMGRGIVATTDDFGVLGQRPTHPMLLDHLVGYFRDHGRSTKQFIKYVASSGLYRASGEYDLDSLERDPTNQFWHHRPPRRMEAEIIRDQMLAVAGNLDDQMFGPPVPIHLTPFMDGRGRPDASGPLDGDRRRSVYVAVRRNFLSPMMTAFDMPSPFSTMGRRNVSNVPAQALIMMNGDFVSAQAAVWAERELNDGQPANDSARLIRMIDTAFLRHPSPRETAATMAFVESNLQTLSPMQVWTQVAQAIFNAKEFIFVR